jgi:molybdopterin converting factor subunit 1
MPGMTVTVKLFAMLRDQAGVGDLRLDLPERATVSAAVVAVGERFPQISKTLARAARAVNLERVSDQTILKSGDELALLPPVSGG